MSKMDDLFKEILREDPPAGPSRIRVIDTPTIQQLRAIPIGSDAIISDDENFMSGVWTAGIAADMERRVEAGTCPHLHAYLAYLPPVPVPESALTAEAITDEAMSAITTLDAVMESRVRVAIQRAVHMAREGMVFTPF